MTIEQLLVLDCDHRPLLHGRRDPFNHSPRGASHLMAWAALVRQTRVHERLSPARRRPRLPGPSHPNGFYAELLGMVRVVDEADWVVIGDAPDRPGVAFERVQALPPSTWPDIERPQYRHFDVAVSDLDAAERAVLSMGARRLQGGGSTFKVFADPAGHPLCLVTV